MRLVEAAVNNNPRHRGDIDNRPAAGLQHQFRFRFAGVPYAGEIDIDHPLPLLALHLQRRIGVGDPGGVDGDVEAAKAVFGQRNGGAQVGNLADIAGKRTSLTADGFNMADRFRQPAVVAKIKTDYPCTRAGEAAGDGLADATAGAGDESDAIPQVKQLLCKVFTDHNVYSLQYSVERREPCFPNGGAPRLIRATFRRCYVAPVSEAPPGTSRRGGANAGRLIRAMGPANPRGITT